MKVLITGFLGFIGKNLSIMLADKGYEVYGIDNLTNSTKEDLNQVSSYVNGYYLKDVLELDSLEGYDVVIHLAATSSVGACESNKALCERNNYTATKHLVELAKKSGAYFIFASSAAVYGNKDFCVDEDSFCEPISYYGETKLMSEHYIKDNLEDFAIFRFFNVYGPYQKPPALIPSIFYALSNNKPFTIYGGSQKRDFVYVRDVANIISMFIELRPKSGVYNLSTSHPYSVKDVIDLISNLTGKKVVLKVMSPKKEDIGYSCGSNKKLLSVLPHQYRFVPFDQGLKETASYYLKDLQD